MLREAGCPGPAASADAYSCRRGVSKVFITLGFSSASIAAIESQFSRSLSSSRLLSLIVPSPAVSSLSERCFLPATDPRIQGTLQAIEDRLLIDCEFVLRDETETSGDGLPPGEGAFLACSFWLVDNYILQGRYVEARTVFERLLARCNDVGLFAEEFDPQNGRMLGNFPQAYSHVGLINCALNLSL